MFRIVSFANAVGRMMAKPSGIAPRTMATICRPRMTANAGHRIATIQSIGSTGDRTARHPSAASLACLLGCAMAMGGSAAMVRAESAAAQKAEDLYANGKGDKREVHQYLSKLVVEEPQSPDALWRMARACHDLAALETSKEEKKKLVYLAHDYAKKALELAPESFAAHKWFAITLSSIGDYEGTKASIQNAYVVREHFEKALELNPKDATTHHLLGLWHYTIADLPWYAAKIAGALFATPPTSDFETALKCFQTAEDLDPGFYKKNAVMIGDTLAKLKRPEEAQKWYAKALSMPIDNADDQAAHDDAQKKIKA